MSEAVAEKTRSQTAFERAKEVIPGGVNSPARSLKAVCGEPVFIDRADGAYMFDVDGNKYIDYVGSWGPMILGHRHPRVEEALEESLRHGTSFGAPCLQEVEIAELIAELIPSVEMVRMVNSGTEATMSAIRLARAFTNRSFIVKFDGCYHGHADSFLVKAGSGLATLGISSSEGVPQESARQTISVPFNRPEAVEEVFEKHPDEIACVILEPIVGNSGLILPEDGFLEKLREITDRYGALLVFDEVMTGFRVGLDGAQGIYGISPDLTCLGKVIGGGLPVGAYGGRKDIMQLIAPAGPVYQAGTLSGNPLAMAAGLAQLKMLRIPLTYDQLKQRTQRLAEGFLAVAAESPVPFQVVWTTGMVCVFFTGSRVKDLESAQTADTELFAKFWKSMLDHGIYWPPSQFEAAFLSLMHSKQDLDETVEAFSASIKSLAA